MDRDVALSGLKAITTVISGTDGDVPETYLKDGRRNTGAALAVVAPSTIEEIHAIIDFALANNLRIVPQGARTGLVGGTVPLAKEADSTLIMTMEKYILPIDYNEVDRRVIVAAGIKLDEANEVLAKSGVQIPVHFSVPDALIGGITATNVGGERVVRYGNLRQNTRGIEVVFANPDFRVYSTLNRPIKDNSAPDMTAAFVGSNGALGIITRVEIDVVPTVDNLQAAWFQIPDGVSLTDILVAAKDEYGQLLQACEFVSREALGAVKNSKEQAQSNVSMPFQGNTDSDSFFLVWESTGLPLDEDEVSIARLTSFIERAGLQDCDISNASDVEDIRRRVSDAVFESGPKLIACDISALTTTVNEFRKEVRDAIQAFDKDLVIADFGHLGDGGFHMNVVVPESLIGSWNDEKTLDLRRAISRSSTKVFREHLSRTWQGCN
jgi:FAD/FMN-containing dehydrogenase